MSNQNKIKDNEKKEFHTMFQIDKMTIFNVNYYTLGSNSSAYFSTDAAKFVRNKLDYASCGQAQDRLLSKEAMKFYQKWDELHLSDLTLEEYQEIRKDMDILKERYNYIENISDRKPKGFHFSEVVEFSKQEPKKIKKQKKDNLIEKNDTSKDINNKEEIDCFDFEF